MDSLDFERCTGSVMFGFAQIIKEEIKKIEALMAVNNSIYKIKSIIVMATHKYR